jgi:hypothetical protein
LDTVNAVNSDASITVDVRKRMVLSPIRTAPLGRRRGESYR